MTTDRQKAAIHFCEKMLSIKFKGNIDNSNQVSEFLSEYLENAKNLHNEITHEYYKYASKRVRYLRLKTRDLIED